MVRVLIYGGRKAKFLSQQKERLILSTSLIYFYQLLRYEKYGSNSYSTLVNRLATSVLWIPLFHNTIGLSLEISVSLFGPFSETICYFQLLLRNVCGVHSLNMLFALIVVKYFSIFMLKNPTCIDVEFWSLFLNSASMLITITFQVTFLLFL